MTIESEHLILKPYTESERDGFVALNCDPIARAEMNGPHTAEHSDKFFSSLLQQSNEYPNRVWAAFEKQKLEYVGHLFFVEEEPGEYEVGFIFSPEHWGKGYATESLISLMNFVPAEIKAEKLIATVNVDHLPSQRVLQKAGFQFQSEDTDEFGPYYIYTSTAPYIAPYTVRA